VNNAPDVPGQKLISGFIKIKSNQNQFVTCR